MVEQAIAPSKVGLGSKINPEFIKHCMLNVGRTYVRFVSQSTINEDQYVVQFVMAAIRTTDGLRQMALGTQATKTMTILFNFAKDRLNISIGSYETKLVTAESLFPELDKEKKIVITEYLQTEPFEIKQKQELLMTGQGKYLLTRDQNGREVPIFRDTRLETVHKDLKIEQYPGKRVQIVGATDRLVTGFSITVAKKLGE